MAEISIRIWCYWEFPRSPFLDRVEERRVRPEVKWTMEPVDAPGSSEAMLTHAIVSVMGTRLGLCPQLDQSQVWATLEEDNHSGAGVFHGRIINGGWNVGSASVHPPAGEISPPLFPNGTWVTHVHSDDSYSFFNKSMNLDSWWASNLNAVQCN